MDRICSKCGAHFVGYSRDTHCPGCRKTASRVLHVRTCAQCGREYETYATRSYYCGPCAQERKKQADLEYRIRRAAGKSRSMGSTAICRTCGEIYVVTGGNQVDCPDCGRRKLQELDRQRALAAYYAGGKERRRQRTENGIKAAPVRAKCVICGRGFDVSGRRTKTCSAGCARQNVELAKIKWEAEHREERNAYHKKRRIENAET